ncbi:hypothetical protein TNCT_199061 [Trichonephila clavata]|uniref:Uncharacterized protein n=1 Tax=Trichonephila clavata TaxID=2740835 RepID=A0A8X6GSU2_TRICU|nr:hypothetical protein TNCT_199061 [Trichonephila clavata]
MPFRHPRRTVHSIDFNRDSLIGMKIAGWLGCRKPTPKINRTTLSDSAGNYKYMKEVTYGGSVQKGPDEPLKCINPMKTWFSTFGAEKNPVLERTIA